MNLQYKRLHPTFVAEVSTPIDLRRVDDDETLEAIRAGMYEHAVLVFRDQGFSGTEQLEFARRLDGELHAKTGASAIVKNRFGDEALTDISNVDAEGAIMARDDRRRLYGLANRLWHTDASFQDPPGRYSMLFARVLPVNPPPTEFADTRTAYDRLDAAYKARLEGLEVHHSIAYSRETLGFDFSAQEKEQLKGAIHPLVRHFPENDRRALYVASHASRILGWSLPEGRLLIRDLMERCTLPDLVYSHAWQAHDLVIWDNRATMHRAMSFDDTNQRRELHRVTTLDLPLPVSMARSA
ncbi:MAG: TauD/TfdA family dioxygenase [Gammaproteobacteria bacterium]|nr:TauD/TfdA family dioxygenase [Gammaproteobacteria bacterium]